MERKNLVIVVVATVALCTLSLIVFGSVASPAQKKTFPNVGSIKAIGVGVYWDQACASPVSSVDWGIVSPGSNVNKTVYIRNEGNAAAALSMIPLNWNPLNSSNYITFCWNYGGQTLNVNQVILVKFTLSVSSSIAGITSFSFDITLTANG